MNKSKILDIIEYIAVILIILFSIFEILTFSLTLDTLISNGESISMTILGIVCFTIVFIFSILLLFFKIKKSLYRSKFKKNY